MLHFLFVFTTIYKYPNFLGSLLEVLFSSRSSVFLVNFVAEPRHVILEIEFSDENL